jgi:predicted helicase
VLKALETSLDLTYSENKTTSSSFASQDIFNYMYAVFHSPEYRRRYSEFLKIDFPRLPLTSSVALFRALAALGEQLVALHLMKDGAVDTQRFPEPGFPAAAASKAEDGLVEKVKYLAPGGRVYINATQYFDGVPPEVWDFHVGGYKVCEKWLKDRKGRRLSGADIDHYARVVATLAQTRALMAEIDAVIDSFGGWPIT